MIRDLYDNSIVALQDAYAADGESGAGHRSAGCEA